MCKSPRSSVEDSKDAEEAKHEYGLVFDSFEDLKDMDAIVIAVGHDQFSNLSQEALNEMFKKGSNDNKVLLDIKGVFDRKEYEEAGYKYWRL